ncbi:tyrosine-protein phosphatase [Listeria costaricensis]|uniref:tyrosine-protein phosphatase n=1 Tax=Listeria costaricensis TaxID=2026604 RepID=UPI000C072623|nr:tyrosine-protein phosphatase [Listeria costaricensis]
MNKWIKTIGVAIIGSSLVLSGCSNSSDEKASAESTQKAKKTVEPGSQIKLEGAVNVRDLGGYKTTSGKTIKPHKLIRSAEMYKMTGNDIKKLTDTYNLKKVVDFRTDSEVKAKPDPPIEGVENIHDPIMKDTGVSTSTEDFMANLMTMDNPEDYLVEANKSFIDDEFSRNGYKEFFKQLLNNEDGAVLWHCTAGKDRAGFGTALVLSALGVDRETVMDDYMLSNKYRADENQKSLDEVAKATNNNQKAVDAMEAMMDVREVYLDAAFDEMDAKYGSTEGYLKDGLGLTQADIEQLQEMYLE